MPYMGLRNIINIGKNAEFKTIAALGNTFDDALADLDANIFVNSFQVVHCVFDKNVSTILIEYFCSPPKRLPDNNVQVITIDTRPFKIECFRYFEIRF